MSGIPQFDAIGFDHRVGQHLVGDFGRELPRLGRFAGGEIELEVFALADVGDRPVSQRVEGFRDRAALRIEHRRFQRDEHACAHGFLLYVERGAPPARRTSLLFSASPAFLAFAAFPKTRSKMSSTCRSWTCRSKARS